MMKTQKLYRFAFALIVLVSIPAQAEQVLRFKGIDDQSNVRVDGTSTVHDWTVKSQTLGGQLDFKFDLPADASTQAIREAIVANPQAYVDVMVAVKSLKSGKKDMDKKMYAALKADEEPTIRYHLTKLTLAEGTKASQEQFDIKTVGSLTIAGETRDVEIPMVLKVVDPQHLTISGNLEMKMTDFKVKPPEALFGAIKSRDNIKVTFEWSTVRVTAQQAIGQ
jgi:polyisoprenoid-binding protein YceI